MFDLASMAECTLMSEVGVEEQAKHNATLSAAPPTKLLKRLRTLFMLNSRRSEFDWAYVSQIESAVNDEARGSQERPKAQRLFDSVVEHVDVGRALSRVEDRQRVLAFEPSRIDQRIGEVFAGVVARE